MKKLNWNAGADLFIEFMKYVIGLGFGIMVVMFSSDYGDVAFIIGFTFCAFMPVFMKLIPPDKKPQ